MKNDKIIKEWIDFAEMDLLTAKHLYKNMYPKPLEIICYHCQQSIEKLLKAALIANNVPLKKTHDLGLLAEILNEYVSVSNEYMDICDNLSPYGIKIRYPQELSIDEYLAKKAITETEELYDWLIKILVGISTDNIEK